MFSVCIRNHGRALYSPSLFLVNRQCFSLTCQRSASSTVTLASQKKYLREDLLEAHGPVAEKLKETGLWLGRTKKSPKSASGDKARVNITSDQLCEDILSYIGPSLQRHHGCDLLDLYPGAGVWSSKLHEFLQPRSHILLEPDEKLYRPFLQPLLDKPGTRLVPKQGIIWRELASVLTPEYLPHQIVPDRKEDLTRPNDTLLVTANLAFYPKKRFLGFESVTPLLLHQFVDAIRTSTLFHRYGQVRMLIWTQCEDKTRLLPSSIQMRKRSAIMGEILCQSIHEVCGNDTSLRGWYAREDAINTRSIVDVVKKMRAKKIVMPAGRESDAFKEAQRLVRHKQRVPSPGRAPPTFTRRYQQVLADLEADAQQGEGLDDSDHRAMQVYQWRAITESRREERVHQLLQGLDEIVALRKSGQKTEELAAMERAWVAEMEGCTMLMQDDFMRYKDNLHCFRQTPPILSWDRRLYEPMEVQAHEFFPTVHCSLLDFEPKRPHPLLRPTGEQSKSNFAADTFDLLMGHLLHQPTQPVSPTLDGLWPGASDYILPRWKSVQDLSRGGFPIGLAHAEPVPRLLNARQWEELLELWLESPFRPEFHEMVARTHVLVDSFDESNASE